MTSKSLVYYLNIRARFRESFTDQSRFGVPLHSSTSPQECPGWSPAFQHADFNAALRGRFLSPVTGRAAGVARNGLRRYGAPGKDAD